MMVVRAQEGGLLQPHSCQPIRQRLSLYADDAVIFLQPTATDINLTLGILHPFGEALGLKINIQKKTMCCLSGILVMTMQEYRSYFLVG